MSGDSLNDKSSAYKYNSSARSHHHDPSSDAISMVSGLTFEDYSNADIPDDKGGGRKSLIPKPKRAKKKSAKVPVWKMEPIMVKPYIPVPAVE